MTTIDNPRVNDIVIGISKLDDMNSTLAILERLKVNDTLTAYQISTDTTMNEFILVNFYSQYVFLNQYAYTFPKNYVKDELNALYDQFNYIWNLSQTDVSNVYYSYDYIITQIEKMIPYYEQ